MSESSAEVTKQPTGVEVKEFLGQSQLLKLEAIALALKKCTICPRSKTKFAVHRALASAIYANLQSFEELIVAEEEINLSEQQVREKQTVLDVAKLVPR